MNTTKTLLTVGALLATSNCVYGPLYDDTIPSTDTLVTFNLFATQPGAQMTAECAPHYGSFIQFGSSTSSSSPLTLNGESIYAAPLKKVIPESCWDYGFGKPLTFLRFFQTKNGSTYNVQVFDQDGPTCIGDHLGDGEGFITAGYACRKTDSSQQIRLRADE